MLDFMLRVGPYGDGFGTKEGGLTLQVLEENPHGVDLGYLQPRIPEVLRTASGKIELAPAPLVSDVARLQQYLAKEKPAKNQLLLIGRRDLRSNNSWMHNLNVLVKGKNRCTLLLHPSDADRLGFGTDGELATVSSRTGSVQVPIELTTNIMPGVVSLPHGWGHNRVGAHLTVASEHAGINTNILADEAAFDPLSGNAILNGIEVTVSKA
jgi:anaerobic selenocysteine-containing dehydrogenase